MYKTYCGFHNDFFTVYRYIHDSGSRKTLDNWHLNRAGRKGGFKQNRQKEAVQDQEKQSETDADSVCLLSFFPPPPVLIEVSSLPLTKCSEGRAGGASRPLRFYRAA